jgi:hypothetical protein
MTSALDRWGWVDALYLGARALWPDLTYDQFVEAAQVWMDHQPTDQPRIVDAASGIEAVLRVRYGAPAEEGDA